MTPEKQRIAIAEACGWARPEWKYGQYEWNNPQGVNVPSSQFPDYLNDLNAMHEAEKVLRKVMKPSDTDTIIGNRMRDYAERLGYAIDATAAQRAEAFLRTLSLWEDDK